MTAATAPRIGLVLGGGGLKGFAHLGVLKVLEEAGIRPTLFAGSSIGALIASAYGAGAPLRFLVARATALTRKQLFRVNTAAIARAGLKAPSFYAAEPLAALIASVVPPWKFDELAVPVLVNTVDLERGMQVVWGSPGFAHVAMRDAVYASCALPGFFPPGRVGHRTCVDGGTCDNLPVSWAALGVDALIAVDVGNSEIQLAADIVTEGLGSIFMRSATLMMRTARCRSRWCASGARDAACASRSRRTRCSATREARRSRRRRSSTGARPTATSWRSARPGRS